MLRDLKLLITFNQEEDEQPSQPGLHKHVNNAVLCILQKASVTLLLFSYMSVTHKCAYQKMITPSFTDAMMPYTCGNMHCHMRTTCLSHA